MNIAVAMDQTRRFVEHGIRHVMERGRVRRNWGGTTRRDGSEVKREVAKIMKAIDWNELESSLRANSRASLGLAERGAREKAIEELSQAHADELHRIREECAAAFRTFQSKDSTARQLQRAHEALIAAGRLDLAGDIAAQMALAAKADRAIEQIQDKVMRAVFPVTECCEGSSAHRSGF